MSVSQRSMPMPACMCNVLILVSWCTFSPRRSCNRFLMMERMKGQSSVCVCVCAHAFLPCHLLSCGPHLGPSVQLTGNQQQALSKCDVCIWMSTRPRRLPNAATWVTAMFSAPPPDFTPSPKVSDREKVLRHPRAPTSLKPDKDGGQLSLSHEP